VSEQLPLIEATGLGKKFARKFGYAAKVGLRTWAHEVTHLQRPNPERALKHDEFWALKHVSFKIQRGESLAVVGQNGSGKTVLARILAGIYKPDIGNVITRGKVVALFARGAGFSPVLSGYENIFINMSLLGMSDAYIRKHVDEVIDFAELPEGALAGPVRTYSSGMRARLSFACAIFTNPEMMIVDEALAVGDLEFRAKCYNRLGELRRQGTSFILVSHNLKGLMQVCDRAIYLHKGRLVSDGPAVQVISKFKSIMQADTLQEPMLPVSEQDGRVEKVRILRCFFRDRSGAETRELKSGEPVSIVLECDAVEDVEEISMVAILKDPTGDLGSLATLDSVSQKMRWNLRAGSQYQLAVAVDCLRLRAGEYHVKVFLAGGHNHNMLDAIEKVPFSVAGNETTIGHFHHEARVLSGVTGSA